MSFYDFETIATTNLDDLIWPKPKTNQDYLVWPGPKTNLDDYVWSQKLTLMIMFDHKN